MHQLAAHVMCLYALCSLLVGLAIRRLIIPVQQVLEEDYLLARVACNSFILIHVLQRKVQASYNGRD